GWLQSGYIVENRAKNQSPASGAGFRYMAIRVPKMAATHDVPILKGNDAAYEWMSLGQGF
ncbi:hypothetical protein, partial [Aliiruegeria sabulilitoris]|uniref:hypothetical protein n=1 Tax=Aliiruegeria sabulilitoris TaxID=1510458 RepID=UPI001E44A743